MVLGNEFKMVGGLKAFQKYLCQPEEYSLSPKGLASKQVCMKAKKKLRKRFILVNLNRTKNHPEKKSQAKYVKTN